MYSWFGRCGYIIDDIGAVLSFSNYLKRTANQLTAINMTSDNRLHVYYLKPEGYLGCGIESEVTADLKTF